MTSLNDELQLVAKHRHDAQASALYWQSDNADVHRARFDLLNDLAAEVAIDADADRWIFAVKTLEHLWQHIEKRGFIGADREYSSRLLPGMRKCVARFVMQSQQTLRILQQDFAGWREANSFAGTVK